MNMLNEIALHLGGHPVHCPPPLDSSMLFKLWQVSPRDGQTSSIFITGVIKLTQNSCREQTEAAQWDLALHGFSRLPRATREGAEGETCHCDAVLYGPHNSQVGGCYRHIPPYHIIHSYNYKIFPNQFPCRSHSVFSKFSDWKVWASKHYLFMIRIIRWFCFPE